jgi:Ca2+/Na+ antiporter
MVIALGFWSLALGYTLVYTGVQWFTSGSSSLAANLGLKSALITAPTTATATAGTGGPSGTGYPSSTQSL